MKNNKATIIQEIKAIEKQKQGIFEQLKILIEQEQMFEIFNDPKTANVIQRDVLENVALFKSLPGGFGSLAKSFENAYLNIIKTINSNPNKVIEPNEEKQLVDLIVQTSNLLPLLFSTSANVSASSKRDVSVALNFFNQSQPFNAVKNNIDEFTANIPEVNVASLKQVFSDQNLSSAIDEILGLSSSKLLELVYDAKLSSGSKQNIVQRIEKYKTQIDSDKSRSTGSPTVVATPSKKNISPELAALVSGNFKQYMEKMKQKFGKDGLEAMKQAIEQELRSQA